VIVKSVLDVLLCCLIAFSGMTAIATYLLTKEIWNSGAGLFAACFIAVGQLLCYCHAR